MSVGLVSGEVSLLVLQMAAFPLCPHLDFSLCMCILAVFSSKDISPIGLGSLLMTLFNLSYLHKGYVSRCIHILRYWELIGGLTGRHNSVHNREGGKRQEKEVNMRTPKDWCLKISSPQSFGGGRGELRRESVTETAQ